MRTLTLYSLICLAGCAPVIASTAREIGAVKTRQFKSTGSVVLLPTRNCIQNGLPHPKCAGTGAYFQQQLAIQMKAFTTFSVSVAPEDAELNSNSPTSTEAAVAYGTKVGATYVFRTALGEFRNAAPWSGRSDFVTLETADLIDVETGEVVWHLTAPIETERMGNAGNHFELLDRMTRPLAQRLASNQPRGICPATARPEWTGASAVEKKRMTTECSSADQ